MSHTKPAQTLHLAFHAAALQTSASSATSIHPPQACLNFGTVVVRSVADTGNQPTANLAALKTIQSLTDLVEADWRDTNIDGQYRLIQCSEAMSITKR